MYSQSFTARLKPCPDTKHHEPGPLERGAGLIGSLESNDSGANARCGEVAQCILNPLRAG